MKAFMSEAGKTLDCPEWADGSHIDERKFCQTYAQIYPMVYSEGRFFSVHGLEPEEKVRKNIYDYLCLYYSTDLNRLVTGLMEIMKLEYHQERFRQPETVIHVANGTFRISQGLSGRKEPCRCRLPVAYNPKAPAPKQWLAFLQDLLEPEDIPTLQEFMGYCLVPVNYAQKMLLILGSGGEGKSRIGVVLSHLLGESMCNGSLTRLENNRFSRADLQNRLVMVDDDLQMEALTSTGIIKSIVTAEQRLEMERKGVQSYQGEIFCRLLAFGNGNLRALHDRSHGFFRRQIILTAKPRPRDRVDDPYLAQRLTGELEGIFQWCLDGLERLLQQDMHFTLSFRAQENLNGAIREGNNTLEFLDSVGYIRRDPLGEISARHLYSIYGEWCDDNSQVPLSAKSFISCILQEADRLGLRYSNHIPAGNGRQVRGFRGIRGVV